MYKIKSRKFQVWALWTLLVIASIVITKTIEPTVISWYGGISMIYIGGNVAQKYLEDKKSFLGEK